MYWNVFISFNVYNCLINNYVIVINDNYENSYNSSICDYRKGRINDKGDEYRSDI